MSQPPPPIPSFNSYIEEPLTFHMIQKNRISSKLPTVSGINEKEFEKKVELERKEKEREEKGKGKATTTAATNTNGDVKGKGKSTANQEDQPKEAGAKVESNEKNVASTSKQTKSSKTIASLGKFGSFDTGNVVGLPFGHTFEISDLDPRDPKALKVVMSGSLEELEETDANNQLIDDTGSNPTITLTDIEELKRSGINGREIIQKQIEMSQSYDLRTVYSQDKYTKRKESKYLKLFTPLAPTLAQISQHHFERNPERVRNLRPDSLSQILGLANIKPGGRYLIIDSTGGVLAAGCLERMGGEGFLLALTDSDSPPAFDMISQMNFNNQVIDRVLSYLNWSMVSKCWKPSDHSDETSNPNTNAIAEDSSSKMKPGRKAKLLEREKSRLEKRKEALDEIQDTREELFKGEFDALIISTHYEPVSMVDRLLPYLSGSSNVLVHGPYLQPLIEAQARLRLRQECLNVTVTEPWLRRYQVLPGRTHPEMQTSATGGFILHFMRVLNDEESERLMQSSEISNEVKMGEAKMEEVKMEEVNDEEIQVGKKRSIEQQDPGSESDATSKRSKPNEIVVKSEIEE